IQVELDLCGSQLNRYLAKLSRLFPIPLGASDRQSQKREVVGVMLVAFERPAQSYQCLLGVFVLEKLNTFPELSHGIELGCALGSLFPKSEVHGGSLGNESGLQTNLVRSITRSLLALRSVLTKKTKDRRRLFGSRGPVDTSQVRRHTFRTNLRPGIAETFSFRGCFRYSDVFVGAAVVEEV